MLLWGVCQPCHTRRGQLGIRGSHEVGLSLRASEWHRPLALAPQCFCPVCGPGRQMQVLAPRRGQGRPGLVWGPGSRGGSSGAPRDIGLRRLHCDCPKGSGDLQGGEPGVCR